MATYIFNCKNCGKTDIELQLPMSFDDYKNLVCPYCKKKALMKVITAPTFISGSSRQSSGSNSNVCSTGNCCIGGNCS